MAKVKPDSKIRAVGFDFDDTLFLSEREKVDIAAELFKKLGITKGVKKLYKSLVGKGIMTRDKLKIMMKKLCCEPTPRELTLMEKAFNKEYLRRLDRCPLVQCSNIIKEIKRQVEVTFIISLMSPKLTTPLLKHCGLLKYFDEILGAPKGKVANFRSVMRKYKLQPQEMVYIGDTKNDVIVSKIAKIHFIGITPRSVRQRIMQRLGADFTFSSLCELPVSLVIEEPRYERIIAQQYKLRHRKRPH